MSKTFYSKVCPVCNKTFQTPLEKAKYCSRKCYLKRHTITPKGKRTYKCFCVMCSKCFEADDPDTLFCSEECRKRRGAVSMFRKP